MVTLTLFTYILNLIALSLAIWLGFYVITYSPRRLISWLTGLALWSISGIFLNMLLAITPPPPPAHLQNWQLLLFPFWSQEVFQSGVSGWLSGWLATPAIAIWHHITILLREEKPNNWFTIQILVVYLLAGVTIYAQINSTLMFSEASGDPLKLNFLKPGIYYAMFMSLLMVVSGISAYNLFVAARSSQSNLIRKQLSTLFAATCLAGITGPVSFLALFEQVSVPRVINTLLLSATIIMIGISITRFSALIEGRMIRRDLLYNASVVSIILIIYFGLTWLAVQLFDIPSFIYIYIAVVAIFSHSLVDIARRYLGRVFLGKEEQDLRAELHRLSRLEEPKLDETIDIMLKSLCLTIRATSAVLFMFESDRINRSASCNFAGQGCPLSKDDLLADDLLQFKPKHFPPPFGDATLLVPLYHHANQIGVIIFGHPVNGIEYPEKDLELILESSDLIAETIITLKQHGQSSVQTAEMFHQIQAPQTTFTHITPKMLEDLLRNVLDYAYLGRSEFAVLPLVCSQLGDDGSTHLDRGKCVYQILSDVVTKLKPDSDLNRDPPPREWHPFLILQWAYFEDTPNREIMARLYISEGTFNRTRRSALRSISQALEEMQLTAT